MLLPDLIYTVSVGSSAALCPEPDLMQFFPYFLKSSPVFFACLWPFIPEAKKSILVHRLNFSDAGGCDRKILNRIGWNMWNKSPFFGLGLGTFMYNFEKFNYDKEEYPWDPAYDHNCYLQIAAETGIVGLAGFLWLIGTFFIHSIASLTKIKDRFHHAVLSGISAGIIVTLVHSIVDTNLYSLPLAVLFWLMLGINAALQRSFTFKKIASR